LQPAEDRRILPVGIESGAPAMLWRIGLAALALGAALYTPALGASLADLAPDQRQLAGCMLSVLNTTPRFRDTSLEVVEAAKPNGPTTFKVFLDYAYAQSDGVIASNRLDIDPFIAPPNHKIPILGLSGVTGAGFNGKPQDLDDRNFGMIALARLWRTRCGLDLTVITL
jgi:hypothetical protein